MKFFSIASLSCRVILASAFTMAASLSSAAYPEKPIKMLIGYAPGSSTDIVGRMVAQDLSVLLKQPIIVENHGGAAGSIAADLVAKAAPDGYTILFAQNGLAINVAANPRLPFNGMKDLVPVVGVSATPHILILNSNSPIKSVSDLIADLKANPGKRSYASSGIGNSDHMAGELFLSLTSTQAIHVPYKYPLNLPLQWCAHKQMPHPNGYRDDYQSMRRQIGAPVRLLALPIWPLLNDLRQNPR